MITSKQIAEICGVSRGTVDRAINGRPGVNEETKQKILKKAEELGYTPNFAGRCLSKGKTYTIGIVLFDLKNNFLTQLATAIEARALERKYFAYLGITEKNPGNERKCIENLMQRKIDGLILCSVVKDADYSSYLKGLGIPVLTIANKVSDDLPLLAANDFKATQEAVDYILSRGYKRIIYVSPPLKKKDHENVTAPVRRYEGFIYAVKGCSGDIETIVHPDYDYIAEIRKINFNEKKTAVLCSSDVFALEVMSYFFEAGLWPGSDAGLMGIDNIDILRFIKPRLTTISFDTDTYGKTAADIIIDMIEGKTTPFNVFLNHNIIEGETV